VVSHATGHPRRFPNSSLPPSSSLSGSPAVRPACAGPVPGGRTRRSGPASTVTCSGNGIVAVPAALVASSLVASAKRRSRARSCAEVLRGGLVRRPGRRFPVFSHVLSRDGAPQAAIARFCEWSANAAQRLFQPRRQKTVTRQSCLTRLRPKQFSQVGMRSHLLIEFPSCPAPHRRVANHASNASFSRSLASTAGSAMPSISSVRTS
jgi:hypothetical protein